MTLYILLGAMILIALIFLTLIQKAKGSRYIGQNSRELFTSDVIDDDTDDPYFENDWKDISYIENDFKEDDWNASIDLYDDMIN